MQQDLSNYRKSYSKANLSKKDTPSDPITLFRDWFLEADNNEKISEANAMTLSTIGLDGFPKGRVVLLKSYSYEGFVFYSHYLSEKGKAITQNNHVCLSFFWPVLERQIIIKGQAHKIEPNLSDGYFESRPRGSRLGAIVSPQSEVIESREVLEDELKKNQVQYEGKEIPRPEHWGGYCVNPISVEFWQGRPNRLHDRIRYTLQQDYNWLKERLAP